MWNGSKNPKRLPVDVTEQEFSDLLTATRQMKHRVAFLMAWGSGMRLSEVLNLKKEDFDLDKGQVRINEGKGKKDRIVPVPRGFKEKHLQHIPFDFKDRALQKAFRTYAEKSGLKKKKPSVHFHSLRHGFATQCLRKGIGLRSIQMMLGHSDLSTTSIYLQLAPEEVLNEYQQKF
jgi:integrase